jgi:hypothetical protein
MGSIKLPRTLTTPVLKAVTDNLARCLEEWVVAERRKAPAALQATLQDTYERVNTTYHEAMQRAQAEGVPLDAT